MSALYVVATPIGNLGDISFRAIETLKKADIIAAEDTRQTQKLLSHYDIHTKLVSYHKFNEHSRGEELINAMLKQDLTVALVSDAGTPAVSDPGAVLVKYAIKNNVPVYSVPGASAVTASVSMSGFANTEFAFYGFPPRKKNEIVRFLKDIPNRNHTAIFYESPYRIKNLLEIIKEIYPHFECAVFSDITKLFEKSFYGSAESILKELLLDSKAEKGEYVLLLNFKELKQQEDSEGNLSLEALLVDEMLKNDQNRKEAINSLAAKGYSKNALYDAALNLKNIFSL